MPRLILLSFDVEEFDTPLEYGRALSEEAQFEACRTGLDRILELLGRKGITATFFTTANYALHHAEQMRTLAARHEIASHGYYHSHLEDRHLLESRLVLEELTGRPILGFRRARMAATDNRLIAAAGYRYNSSENPTVIPGRYNHFFAARTPHLSGPLLNIPASVTPRVRFPLFWLSFKNFPLWWIRCVSKRVLEADGMLCLYFHPWEFIDLSSYGLPWYIRRIDGQRLLDRLAKFIDWLGPRGDFITFGDYDARWRRGEGRGAS